ncbi:MAG: tetratricopeptide repeat protein [bacterium]|nr:tetratricopeptide repeat protein [bacterium]MCP4799776.1 tetratricopeptide repeat protein [bacterium]
MQTRFKFTSGLILSIVIMLPLLLTGSSALAECGEAQQIEATHAFQVAKEFLMAKNWAQAIPSLESALEICDEHENSLKWLGKSYRETGRFDEAVVVFSKLIEVRGQAATANDHMDLGKTFAKLKDYRKARQSYVSAQRLAPTDCSVLFNLAVMHGAVKDYARSVDTYEEVIDNCPQLKEKALPKLAKACQKASEKERKMGNVAVAKEYDKRYQEYAGSAGGSVGYKIIADRMNNGDYSGAVSACDDFLLKNPESTKTHKVLLNKAGCLRALNKNNEATSAYREYLELRPRDYPATGTLIELLAKTGQCEAGVSLAESVASSESIEVYYGWGMALECLERYMDAKEKFKFVAANGSGNYMIWATQQLERQDQLEEIRLIKRQNAGY